MFQRPSPQLVLVTLGKAHPEGAAPRTLKIRMGEAFPPTHPTSRLCLELLQEALAAEAVRSLIDVGCGAGVLSLAAAALGVPLVVAVDLAPRAVRETWENARDNALSGPLTVVQGGAECIKATFDLVLANLPWDVHLNQAPEFSHLAAPAGALILSGFRDHRESVLMDGYQKLGWSLKMRGVKNFRHPELPAGLSFTWAAWTLTRS